MQICRRNIKPGSPEWRKMVTKIKDGKGKGINVTVESRELAELLIKEARPNLTKRPTYEKPTSKSGYEFHPIEPGIHEEDLPHIKWRDWSNGGSQGAGHIYYRH